MKNLLFLSSFLVFLFIILSCNKTKDCSILPGQDKLPMATQIGNDTFGCLMDGKPWVAYVTHQDAIDALLGEKAIEIAQFSYDKNGDSGLFLVLNRHIYNVCDTVNQTLALHIYNPRGNPIGKNCKITANSYTYADYRDKSNKDWYYLDTLSNPTATFTKIDTVYQKNHIPVISGTCSFRVINPNSKDTLTFTNGRFDITPK